MRLEGGANPTGNVTVVVTNSSGDVVATFTEEALTDGTFSFNLPDLAVGEYYVDVTYNGDVNYIQASGKGDFKVDWAVPTVSAGTVNITYGDDETIGVSVSGVGDGAVPYNVTVIYNGDDNYTQAIGESAFKVDKATPVVKADTVNITYGDDETIGVSVSGVGDGAVPTGNVTVVVTDSSGAVVATFTEEALTDGSVELKVTGLDAGEYMLVSIMWQLPIMVMRIILKQLENLPLRLTKQLLK